MSKMRPGSVYLSLEHGFWVLWRAIVGDLQEADKVERVEMPGVLYVHADERYT